MHDLDLRTNADDCRDAIRAACFEAALRQWTDDYEHALAVLRSIARALEKGVVVPEAKA